MRGGWALEIEFFGPCEMASKIWNNSINEAKGLVTLLQAESNYLDIVMLVK